MNVDKKSDTAFCYRVSKTQQLWKTTKFSNLIRYEPSGTYFIRAKVHGKLIRESLETDVQTVAKLRLDDRLKDLRGVKTDKPASKLTFGDAAELFKADLPFQLTSKGTPLKPLSQEY